MDVISLMATVPQPVKFALVLILLTALTASRTQLELMEFVLAKMTTRVTTAKHMKVRVILDVMEPAVDHQMENVTNVLKTPNWLETIVYVSLISKTRAARPTSELAIQYATNVSDLTQMTAIPA